MIERQLGKENSTPSGLETEISKLIVDTISDHLENLSCSNVSDDQAYEELNCVVQAVNQWIQKCTHRETLPSLNSTPSLLRRTSSQINCETTWNELLSTEETIWCPTLGIRGQVDIIVSGNIIESGNIPLNDAASLMIPVELKTGKWRLDGLPGHRAQIILYIVMIIIREGLSWRNRDHRCVGILLYLGARDSETKWEVISPSWSEIRALIQVRNTLAYYLKNSQSEVTSSLLAFLTSLLGSHFYPSPFVAE